MTVIAEVAGEYTSIAVRNINTEFPHATHHTADGPDDPSRPRDLHPAFHGAYDWHSCVHMHWLLVRLLPEVDNADARATLARTLTGPALAVEADYLRANPGFERPYGWAWALALAAACAGSPSPAARERSAALGPLADAVEDLTLGWLDRAVAPVRHGVHSNSAFGLALLHESAAALGRSDLVTAVEKQAISWFHADRDYPAAWEPSGHDFLSPALCEADLMRRVLPADEFPGWLGRFLPGLADTAPAVLFTPAEVRDVTDGHQVHLFGLNLARAWQFRLLAGALPEADPRGAILRRVADRHLSAGLPHVVGEGFASDHWLATYAYLALTA
jgi:hypothetical protein